MTLPLTGRLLVSTIKWDTPQDSKEFFDAYQIFVGIKTRGAGTSEAVGEADRKGELPNETIFVGQALQLLVQWLLQ